MSTDSPSTFGSGAEEIPEIRDAVLLSLETFSRAVHAAVLHVLEQKKVDPLMYGYTTLKAIADIIATRVVILFMPEFRANRGRVDLGNVPPTAETEADKFLGNPTNIIESVVSDNLVQDLAQQWTSEKID